MCVKRTLILACLGDSRIDSELTLGLFYPVSGIIFTFLLILDCMFVCLLFSIDLSLTTVLLIIQSFILIPGVVKLKTS